MVRKKRDSGKDSFELTPEKANKLHDDRSYVLALLSWQLMLLRRDPILNKKKPLPSDLNNYFKVKTPEKPHSYFS